MSIGKENLVFQGSPFSYYGVQALSKYTLVYKIKLQSIFSGSNIFGPWKFIRDMGGSSH